MTFVCYIHVPGSLTPHMRLIEGPREALGAELRLLVEEWPLLERIEVFDQLDQPVIDMRQPGIAAH